MCYTNTHKTKQHTFELRERASAREECIWSSEDRPRGLTILYILYQCVCMHVNIWILVLSSNARIKCEICFSYHIYTNFSLWLIHIPTIVERTVLLSPSIRERVWWWAIMYPIGYWLLRKLEYTEKQCLRCSKMKIPENTRNSRI